MSVAPPSPESPGPPDADRREAARRRLVERQEARQSRPPLPADAELEVYDPRYCIGCNADLHGHEDAGFCPECGRRFDSADPSTYLDEPAPVRRTSYWLEPPRLAGYTLVLGCLLCRAALHPLAEAWRGGDGLSSLFGAGLLAFSVPYLCGGMYLGLLATEDWVGGRYTALLLGCLVLGVVLSLGLPPLVMGVAVLLSPLVALLRLWRSE